MDRSHLRSKDCIRLSHFFCKDGTLVAGRNNLALFRIFLSGADGSDERTDTDTCSAKVVYLINLQAGVNLAGMSQDIADLIGGNSIQSTTERIQLDQIQKVGRFYIICSCIQSGVVHPLVKYDQRAFYLMQMGDGIFGQNCKSVGCNQFRNTVVDLRVNMIWTAGKYDTAAFVVF